MYCANCGRQRTPAGRFCEGCGSPFPAEPTSETPSPPVWSGGAPPSPAQLAPGPPRRKRGALIAAVLVGLGVLGVAGYLLIGRAGGDGPAEPEYELAAGGESRYSEQYGAVVTDVSGEGYVVRVEFEASGLSDLRRPEGACLVIEEPDGEGYLSRPMEVELTTDEATNYAGSITFPALVPGIYSFNYSCEGGYGLAELGSVAIPGAQVSRAGLDDYAVVFGADEDTVHFAAHGLGLPDPASSCLTNADSGVTDVQLDVQSATYALTYIGSMTFSSVPDRGVFQYGCSQEYNPIALEP
jgi:hypothetical protein